MNQPWRTIRSPWFSLRIDRRVPPVMLLAILAMLAAMVINIGVGEYPIAPLDVIRTLLRLPVESAGGESYDFIINTLRLPRMLVAALVGLALGVAGTVLQGLTRNPLADPGILGISAGAGLAAVTLLVALPNVPRDLVPLAAAAGALAAAGLIYVLAWRTGDSPMRLILVGVGVSAVCGALTTLMITFGDVYDVQRALVWLSGSVYGRTWADLRPLLVWVVICVPPALFLAHDLNALNLGEDIARGLGAPVTQRRGILLGVAVALAASSVAAAGTIGFIGLMAPHIGRRLVGPDHRGLLPTAGTIGALILVAADLLGRTLAAPAELPCGLVASAIGAPFFIFLLWRQRRA